MRPDFTSSKSESENFSSVSIKIIILTSFITTHHMFRTCIDLSSPSSSSVNQLSHCFEIIEAVSPDFFVLSSNSVFDLFFDHDHIDRQETTIDSEENEILQRKIEKHCRSESLILKLNFDEEKKDFQQILDCCAFLDIPRLVIMNFPPSFLKLLFPLPSSSQSNEQNRRTKLSFNITNNQQMKEYLKLVKEEDSSSTKNQAEQFSLWIDDSNMNISSSLLPFYLSENCFCVSISSSNSILDRELLSEFAARNAVFNLKLSSTNDEPLLDFDKVQQSVSFLSLLLKSIIEDVGCSIQRKSFLFHNNNRETININSNNNDKSISRELSLAQANDKLQIPLQPLREILPRATYAEFERDDVKYEKYQEAIEYALMTMMGNENENSNNNNNLAIVVLGAGSRGPLVSCVLQSLSKMEKKSKKSFKIFAIEQNALAFQMLKRKFSLIPQKLRNEDVELILGDGRNDETTSKIVDKLLLATHSQQEEAPKKWNLLLISELLGSFGDNELSPECIDGFLESLNRTSSSSSSSSSSKLLQVKIEKVKSIPQRYTSYISPVRAPKLQHEIMKNRLSVNQPFVVKATNVWGQQSWFAKRKDDVTRSSNLINDDDDDDEKDFVPPVFTFDHDFSRFESLSEIIEDMTKKKLLSSDDQIMTRAIEFCRSSNKDESLNDEECEVTGLLGYFDCCLYDNDVTISILPFREKHTPDMYSWFPIYFPLISMNESDSTNSNSNSSSEKSIKVRFERHRKDSRVWYSWMLERNDDEKKMIMNAGGEGFSIKL